MNNVQLVLQFIVSGSIVVGASVLAKHIDAKWSGLIVALPVMTVLGLVFISINNSTETTQRYLISALLFMIPAAIYIASVYLLSDKISLTLSLIIAIIPFILTFLIVQKTI